MISESEVHKNHNSGIAYYGLFSPFMMSVYLYAAIRASRYRIRAPFKIIEIFCQNAERHEEIQCKRIIA